MKKQLLILFICLLSVSCSVFAKPVKIMYLLPEGFTGGVLVLYNQADGVNSEVSKEGTIKYRIPKDGFLKVKGDFPEDVYNFNFFSVNSKDELTSIEYIERSFVPPGMNLRNFDELTEDEKNNKIFAMNHRTIGFEIQKKSVPLYAFSIGYPKDSSSYYDKTLDKVEEIEKDLNKKTLNSSTSKVGDKVKIAYLIPEGYVGGIIMYFSMEGVEPEAIEGDRVFYRIPQNGVVNIKPTLTQTSSQTNFYYVDSNNKLSPIQILYPKGFTSDEPEAKNAKTVDNISKTERDEGIFVMDIRYITAIVNKNNALIYAFSVGHPKDSEIIYNQTKLKARNIDKELNKQAEKP